jgi:hypothetical protein
MEANGKKYVHCKGGCTTCDYAKNNITEEFTPRASKICHSCTGSGLHWMEVKNKPSVAKHKAVLHQLLAHIDVETDKRTGEKSIKNGEWYFVGDVSQDLIKEIEKIKVTMEK